MATYHPHKRAARAVAALTLTLAATLAGIWLAPRASGAVEAWLRTPPVRSTTVRLSSDLAVTSAPRSARASAETTGSPAPPAAGVVTLDPGMKFTLVGVTCRPPARPGGVVIRLRTSLDGSAWSRWYTVAVEEATDGDGKLMQAYTEPVWTGAGRYLQVAARRAGGIRAAPAALHDVRVVALNSTESADAGAALLGVVRRTVAAIAGVRLSQPADAMTTRPEIVTRAEWGADESLRTGSPDYATVKMAFVHHTDSGNDYTRAQAPSIVRAIYYYHTRALHWSDVGYNFLIDRYGTIYEGRYGGMTRGTIGAQVLGFNTGSTGISIIGTFSSVTPPAPAVSALERLLAWKLDLSHVDPQGSATLMCGYGQKFATGQNVRFDAISGHRQANYTDCPGNKLFAMLPAIREAVDAIGQPKIYSFSVDGDAFSPNGDGVQDKVTLGFTLSQPGAWDVRISNAAGDVVRDVKGQGSTADVVWGGRDDQGRDLPDGTYAVIASAQSADGDARAAEAELRLDTTPPKLDGADISPSPFSPNKDGQSDTTKVTFSPGESGKARVTVLDEKGNVVRKVSDWRTVGASAQTVTWDGRILRGGALVDAPEGRNVLEITMRDLAGNDASVRRGVVVDRTLGFPTVSPSTISPNGDGARDSATVGFTLTRQANVTLAVLHGATVVRTVTAGTLAAGDRSLIWDGKLTGGEDAPNGDYQLRVTADGSIGVTSVSVGVKVDRYAPRLTVPGTASVALGQTAGITYSVRDPYSAKVKVTASIADANGVAAGTVACGWVPQGKSARCAWKPPARGSYTLTFTAVDRGGNAQSATEVTTLTVH